MKIASFMIYITGDVHDMSLNSQDQKWLKKYRNITEMDCAIKYAELAEKFNIPITLFVTGLTAVSEPKKLKYLASMHNIEIGGHTWNSLQPSWKHLYYEKLKKSYYGPIKKQREDIIATKQAIEKCISKKITSWRTHSYRSDSITLSVLSEQGFKTVSDDVGPGYKIKSLDNNLLSLPINILPDHEHVYHGYFTEGRMHNDQILRDKPWMIHRFIHSSYYWKRFIKEIVKLTFNIKTPLKPFGPMYSAEQWQNELKTQVRNRYIKNGYACLLLHPADMEILDEMKTLRRIFEYLSNYSCFFVQEAKNFKK